MVTPEQIAEWRRLAEAATPGPWSAPVETGPTEVHGATPVAITSLVHSVAEKHDARFIAAAREAVPALLAEVERLRADYEARREACRALGEAISGLEHEGRGWFGLVKGRWEILSKMLESMP